MKKLVQQKILYSQGFSATLFLHSRTICGQVFREVCDGVAGDLHGGGGPGEAGGELGEDPGGVVHEVGFKSGILDLLLCQVPGQLVNDGPHHLQMTQFLCTHIGVKKYTNSKKP